jgi:hypothetical protein
MAATLISIANRLLLVISMLLIASVGCAQGLQQGLRQGLQKGNLFGVHTITVDLKPGVTIEQFRDFFVGKVLPEYEKQWVGLRGYLVKSFKVKNQFAIVWLFESEAARNRYFTPDDKPNALEKAAYEGVKPIEEALKQFGTYTVKYTDADDWVVQ